MSEQNQSAFVTVVAWLAILAAGFSAVAGLVQVGMNALPDANYFRAFAFARTLLSIATLACAFGLLRRREWARKGLVILLALAVVLIAGMAMTGMGTTSTVVAVVVMAVMAWPWGMDVPAGPQAVFFTLAAIWFPLVAVARRGGRGRL